MSSKAFKSESRSVPTCAMCGGPATRGAMGFLVPVSGVVKDERGKPFPSDALFHGHHKIAIGAVVRARLEIPDDILEMTVSDRVQWERDYESI